MSDDKATHIFWIKGVSCPKMRLRVHWECVVVLDSCDHIVFI